MKITRIIRLLGVFLAFCLISTSFNSQCEFVAAGGPNQQIIMTLPADLPNLPYLWQTTSLDGTVLNNDSDLNNTTFVTNSSLHDTIITCLYSSSGFCCLTYYFVGAATWSLVEPEPCDTVYINTTEYLVDTVYINTTEYLTDTVTLIETEYIDVVIDNYVYTTDTITEFVTNTSYINCETGEECGTLTLCDETSIFAPNTVTPNGDGWNDTWQVIADESCWDQWEIRIYNRWGELVWVSTSSTDEWDGNVAAGVYVYTIIAYSSINNDVFEFNGTISVFY